MAQLKAITPARVVLFGTKSCSYCAQARRYFGREQIAYDDLDTERDMRAYTFELNTLYSTRYPVFVIGREVLYGYNELQLARALRNL